ncbi:hypothetical protein CSKR_104492 [Clonorchis sinensis]|uniref:Uncharacterized protein n=1 Tax=Clonorchis sinensis TaxID=79923 RepID=A0A3R7G021_CLOSI|nr:hypothetical protein CSKR_104492 [Clonorchis sinensis]
MHSRGYHRTFRQKHQESNLKCMGRQHSGNLDAFWTRHRQPAFGKYWIMIDCWVHTFGQSEFTSMIDRQAARSSSHSLASQAS